MNLKRAARKNQLSIDAIKEYRDRFIQLWEYGLHDDFLTAIDNNDYAKIAKILHQLKSYFGTLDNRVIYRKVKRAYQDTLEQKPINFQKLNRFIEGRI